MVIENMLLSEVLEKYKKMLFLFLFVCSLVIRHSGWGGGGQCK